MNTGKRIKIIIKNKEYIGILFIEYLKNIDINKNIGITTKVGL